MKSLLLLALSLHLASAVTHSLMSLYTSVSSGGNIPHFFRMGVVDGEQINYYDSNIRKLIPKTEWIKKINADDPDYWDRETQKKQNKQQSQKNLLNTFMQLFSHSEGVHTLQWMYGCELDDDGSRRGFEQFGYDGEDFLTLDMKNKTWTAAKPQAVTIKQKWDRDVGWTVHKKDYLENKCIDWLQKYVGYGKSSLERKVPPKTDLFQRDSSSPVVCFAAGFFPKPVNMTWQKNGEDVDEDVKTGETLPSPNSTYQKRSVLTVSPEELKNNKYTCVIQHSSLEAELNLSHIRILTDPPDESLFTTLIFSADQHFCTD